MSGEQRADQETIKSRVRELNFQGMGKRLDKAIEERNEARRLVKNLVGCCGGAETFMEAWMKAYTAAKQWEKEEK